MNINESIASVKDHGFFKHWMPALQRLVIQRALKGEEKLFFVEMLSGLRERIEAMPMSYETDGQGDDAIAYLHYFLGGIDAWITEKDKGEAALLPCECYEQLQAFGKVCLTGDKEDAELGYVSIQEMIENGVELDLYWTPKKLKEV